MHINPPLLSFAKRFKKDPFRQLRAMKFDKASRLR